MAYRTRGSTNDDMVDKLKLFGIVDSDEIEEAFRSVDRALFMPQNEEGLASAYRDEPHRQEAIHLSAPHIYAASLAALDLASEDIGSFLNVGSGSGYFSALVCSLIGYHHQHFGIEAQEKVVQHARESLQRWDNHHHVQVFHGSAFNLDATQGEGRFGMDRIYIGAAVSRAEIPHLAKLLKKGGVLVCPVEDEMVKVVRVRVDSNAGNPPRSHRASRPPLLSNDFSVQVLSAVRFSYLVKESELPPVVLPSLVWNPSLYQKYPSSFQQSCKSLLMCSRASAVQPKKATRPNNAAILPQSVWLEVLSFCHYDWFSPVDAGEKVWQGLLQQEQEARRAAEDQVSVLQHELAVCRRERAMYQALAEQWRERLQLAGAMNVDNIAPGDDEEEESVDEFLMDEDSSSSSSDDDSTMVASPNSVSFAQRRTVSISDQDIDLLGGR